MARTPASSSTWVGVVCQPRQNVLRGESIDLVTRSSSARVAIFDFSDLAWIQRLCHRRGTSTVPPFRRLWRAAVRSCTDPVSMGRVSLRPNCTTPDQGPGGKLPSACRIRDLRTTMGRPNTADAASGHAKAFRLRDVPSRTGKSSEIRPRRRARHFSRRRGTPPSKPSPPDRWPRSRWARRPRPGTSSRDPGQTLPRLGQRPAILEVQAAKPPPFHGRGSIRASPRGTCSDRPAGPRLGMTRNLTGAYRSQSQAQDLSSLGAPGGFFDGAALPAGPTLRATSSGRLHATRFSPGTSGASSIAADPRLGFSPP